MSGPEFRNITNSRCGRLFLVPDDIPLIGDFLHLGDGSPADLLENMVDLDFC